jgi:hypothetical protein
VKGLVTELKARRKLSAREGEIDGITYVKNKALQGPITYGRENKSTQKMYVN